MRIILVMFFDCWRIRMTYFINAWLERPQPYLQVIHRDSGRVCVDFPAPVLEELCRNGDICPGDLRTSTASATKEVVRHLFHMATLNGCRVARFSAAHKYSGQSAGA